jgi:FkbM family methyltransferase
VLAVEAAERNARLLRTAVAYNGFADVSVVHGVAAGSPGERSFHEDDMWGHVALNGDATERVAAHRVADLVAGLGWPRVDVVKIDVEGYELEVLGGMDELLADDDAPALIVECNGPALDRNGTSLVELKQRIADHGYRLHYVDRSEPGRLVAAEPGDFQPEAVSDYVAFKRIPEALAPWRIDEPMPVDEVARRLFDAVGHPDHEMRTYVAAASRGGPAEVRRHPLVRAAALELIADDDEDVRRALAG